MGVSDDSEKEKGVQVFGGQGKEKRAALWVEGFDEDGPAAILYPWGFWVNPLFELTIEQSTTGQLVRIKPTESARFKAARNRIEGSAEKEAFTRGSADR